MELPREAEAYYRSVIQRCENLIETSIWTGISKIKLRQWLSNFETDKEKYFIACILDQVIYRTHEQTIALIKHLFRYTLPDAINRMGIFHEHIEKLDTLLHKTNYEIGATITTPQLEIRFVGVIKSGDSLTKSSHHIGRLFKKNIGIFDDLIITPAEIEKAIINGVKLFVFFDDFLGTGTQFNDCIVKENIKQFISKAHFIYAPLAAHKLGIETINTNYPTINVICVEYLDESNGVFNDNCNCFIDGINTPTIAKKYFYDLLKLKHINIGKKYRKGFGKLELLYVFEHASPDNTLPILWWHHIPTFKPLFNR